jgi:hypothetical protein
MLLLLYFYITMITDTVHYVNTFFYFCAMIQYAMTDEAETAADLIQSVYDAEIKPIEIGDLECAVQDVDGTRYVAIGGSDEAEDWVRNLRTLPWRSPELKCFCHIGFFKSARAAYPAILQRVYAAERVIVCGHSKGAAEATILAALLKTAGVNVVKLITFGSPRAGFSALANRCRFPVERYVNGHDPVPHVPPSALLILRYRHVGDEIRLSHPDNPGGIMDHFLHRYRAALKSRG